MALFLLSYTRLRNATRPETAGIQGQQMKKSVLGAVLGCALACLAVPSRAEAASITFLFDYTIGPTGLATGPSGPWGSVTISDSALDANRVDISITLTPPVQFTGLNQFFLNLDLSPDSPPTGTDPDFLGGKFLTHLVPTSNPAGNTSGSLGAVGYADGTSFFPINGFLFDLNPNPTSTALTFTGSFALFIDNDSPTPDTPVNLDVNMFFTPSAFTATGGQIIPMFAGYRTTALTSGAEFRAYASTAVPEPGTLSLLGLGMLGLARARRRRRRS